MRRKKLGDGGLDGGREKALGYVSGLFSLIKISVILTLRVAMEEYG